MLGNLHYVDSTDITSAYQNFFLAALVASCSANRVLRVSASWAISYVLPLTVLARYHRVRIFRTSFARQWMDTDLAAPSYWRPEEASECSGGLFIQPRLQFIEIAHHDLLRRRFWVEFFRVDLKAL